MNVLRMILFGSVLLLFASCNDEGGYDYFAYSFIDTVLAADTIRNSDAALVVHVYPIGCNHLERIESRQLGAVLELYVLYHYHYEGLPCAHGSGLDTTSYRLVFNSIGACTLSYSRSEMVKIIQPVFVRE